jgi:hypothetical protein
MEATIYLEDLRCDGSGHGGCQAGCKIYWKEAWLRRVDDQTRVADQTKVANKSNEMAAELERFTQAGTRTVREIEGERSEVWRCQATDALKASRPLKTSDLSQYWRELTNGNYGLLRLIFVSLRGFPMEVARRVGLLRPLPLKGPGNQSKTGGQLDLRPGDLVKVRSPAEIAATLDESGHSARLSFDREMLPFCGHTFRVRQKVRQIVDDKTGRMLKISKDCVILDGAVCSGERSPGTWFCPRQIFPYWREAWLRRVEESDRT